MVKRLINLLFILLIFILFASFQLKNKNSIKGKDCKNSYYQNFQFSDTTLPGISKSGNNKLWKESLPTVLQEGHQDLIASGLRNEAYLRFSEHQLPKSQKEWEKYKLELRSTIIKRANIVFHSELPFNYHETSSTNMKGFTIKNIIFQTRPNVYATANLYIPEGEGPFPAVVLMHGHWPEGKASNNVQACGTRLALGGYVCLSIDAFGSGERTTTHGVFEYHGANLGASLMNIGETLLGFQVSDNVRAVDLLCSLPYVDQSKIGATGASGGGNQTMWLAAIDERVKAAVPVVSVGTFESYIMASNCVCELLVNGLTFTEASGILALVAPRALMMCNHTINENPTFLPPELNRSITNSLPIFRMLGAEKKINYRVFDLTHGYWREDREAMLGWFNLHLKGKGTGQPVKEIPFADLLTDQLMVYQKGERDIKVKSIADYAKEKSKELRSKFLDNQLPDINKKKTELANIVQLGTVPKIITVFTYPVEQTWDKFAIKTSDNKLLPLLHRSPKNRSRGYVIIANEKGKSNIPKNVIEELIEKGYGVLLPDLTGTGESSSTIDTANKLRPQFHTLARAELWLGKTIIGEWIKDLAVITKFLNTKYKPVKLTIYGSKEAGIAALIYSALINESNIDNVLLHKAPISYQFDEPNGIDSFGLGIHLPGILKWGDVSLVAALSPSKITFTDPSSMSGIPTKGSHLEEFKKEFETLRKRTKKADEINFSEKYNW